MKRFLLRPYLVPKPQTQTTVNMMRLFLTRDDAQARILMVPEGTAFEEFKEMCQRKCEIDEEIQICLNVEGQPAVHDISEVRDGDHLKVTKQSGEDSAGSKRSMPEDDAPLPGDDMPVSKRKKKIIQESEDEDEDDESEDEDEDDESEDEDEDSEEEEDEYEDSDEEEDEYEDSEEDSEEEDEDSEEEEYSQASSAGSNRSKRETIGTMEAKMEETAVKPCDGAPGQCKEDDTSDSIKERIKGILERGLHPATPEAEAAQSMRLAEKMLKKHNLTQADLAMNGSGGNIEAGLFKVHLQYTSTRKPCQTKSWFHVLATTVRENFGCKSYFTVKAGSRCFFGFYGIAANAYAAAFAFSFAFNRVSTLVAQHSIPLGEYDEKRRNGSVTCSRAGYTKAAKVSYCDGLATGLLTKVREQKKDEKKDEEKVEEGTSKDDNKRAMALTVMTQKAEDEIIDQHKLNIKKSKHKYHTTAFRYQSYQAGKTDSSKIDINQRSIAA